MELLKHLRYPGRFIVVGRDAGALVAIYGVTGRSTASQARRYVVEERQIVVMPTDEEELSRGKRDLLVYPAATFFDDGFVVANGNQIQSVTTIYDSAEETLEKQLANELAEPDKYFTPRITGCVLANGSMALHTVRGTTHAPERASWSVEVPEGAGKYLATYNGDETNPGQFAGTPEDVALSYGSAGAAAAAVYDLLAPPAGAPDYRVAVIAVYLVPGQKPVFAIRNRFDFQY